MVLFITLLIVLIYFPVIPISIHVLKLCTRRLKILFLWKVLSMFVLSLGLTMLLNVVVNENLSITLISKHFPLCFHIANSFPSSGEQFPQLLPLLPNS